MERTPERRDAVLDARRHFGVDFPSDESVGFQFAKLVRQHSLRDVRRATLEIAET